MPDLVIAGLPAVLLIMALVEAGKRVFGWDAQRCAVAALAAGPVLSLGALLAAKYPPFADYWTALVLGLAASLVAMGVYSGSKAVSGK